MQSFRKEAEEDGLGVCVQSQEAKERKEKGKHRRKCRVQRWEGVHRGGMWQGRVYRPQRHRTLWFCSSASARLSWFATVNQKPRWHLQLFKQFVQFSGSMWLTKQQKTILLSSVSYKHGEKEVKDPCCGPLLKHGYGPVDRARIRISPRAAASKLHGGIRSPPLPPLPN